MFSCSQNGMLKTDADAYGCPPAAQCAPLAHTTASSMLPWPWWRLCGLRIVCGLSPSTQPNVWRCRPEGSWLRALDKLIVANRLVVKAMVVEGSHIHPSRMQARARQLGLREAILRSSDAAEAAVSVKAST